MAETDGNLRDSIAGALSGAPMPPGTPDPLRIDPDAGHGAGDGFPGSDFDPLSVPITPFDTVGHPLTFGGVPILHVPDLSAGPMHPDAAAHFEASATMAANSAPQSGVAVSGEFLARGRAVDPEPVVRQAVRDLEGRARPAGQDGGDAGLLPIIDNLRVALAAMGGPTFAGLQVPPDDDEQASEVQPAVVYRQLLRDDGSLSGMFIAEQDLTAGPIVRAKVEAAGPSVDAAQLLDVAIACLQDGYDLVDGARREFGYDDIRFADVRHGFIMSMYPLVKFLTTAGVQVQPTDPDRKIDFTPPPQLFVLLADVQRQGRAMADFIGVAGGKEPAAARASALKLAADAKLVQDALTTIAKRVPFPDTTPPEVPAGRDDVLAEFSKTRTANGLDHDLAHGAGDWLLFIRQKCREVESAIEQGEDARPTMVEVANLALLLVDTTTRKGGPSPVLPAAQVPAKIAGNGNARPDTGSGDGTAGQAVTTPRPGSLGTAAGQEPAAQAEGAGAQEERPEDRQGGEGNEGGVPGGATPAPDVAAQAVDGGGKAGRDADQAPGQGGKAAQVQDAAGKAAPKDPVKP